MTTDIKCNWRLVLGHSYTVRYSVNLLRLVVVMCLFLSMVVWQPFWSCWRYIIARVSEMHVAYHTIIGFVVYLHQRNKQHSTLKDFAIPLLLSFLPYLHHPMCVRGGENNDGYRVRLKIGVRSLSHRKVQCRLITACCCHVFVPQYGRLAAVSILMALYHCACLRNARRISYRFQSCGIFTSAEQTTFNISNDFTIPLLPPFLPYLHRQMCVWGGENNDEYRVRLKIGVRSLLHRKVQSQPTTTSLLSCVCSSVWSFGSHLGYWRLIIARVSEMHVAYHRSVPIVVYLHQRNKQHSTSPTTLRYHSPLPSFLTCIIECECEEERITTDIECDWRLVLGRSYTGR
jgi:hypothetical protein